MLALLLAHDHFFSKSGIAAPAKHPIRQAFEGHKARLQAEFTRARLRRKCPNIESLKKVLAEEKGLLRKLHPRWARINALTVTDVQSVVKVLPQSSQVDKLSNIFDIRGKGHGYCTDEHIPNLLAFSPEVDLTNTIAYKSGQVILQDKASCFPAYLLLGNENSGDIGDIIDGCAAPGNKTTHVAAIMSAKDLNGRIFACERDAKRSQTLQSMVTRASAEKKVDVLARQDFLALKPEDARFRCVTHLLLDPSCSGSGILGREDIPRLSLPKDPRAAANNNSNSQAMTQLKKRKRDDEDIRLVEMDLEQDAAADEEAAAIPATEERLLKLSNLQSRIVEHAMRFPAAVKITYSTCSIHEQENEVVVSRVLASKIAKERGWRVLPRESQVDGMKRWKHRGVRNRDSKNDANTLDDEHLEACIRCYPEDDQRTMGFFVCGFIRCAGARNSKRNGESTLKGSNEEDDEEWEGFDS